MEARVTRMEAEIASMRRVHRIILCLWVATTGVALAVLHSVLAGTTPLPPLTVRTSCPMNNLVAEDGLISEAGDRLILVDEAGIARVVLGLQGESGNGDNGGVGVSLRSPAGTCAVHLCTTNYGDVELSLGDLQGDRGGRATVQVVDGFPSMTLARREGPVVEGDHTARVHIAVQEDGESTIALHDGRGTKRTALGVMGDAGFSLDGTRLRGVNDTKGSEGHPFFRLFDENQNIRMAFGLHTESASPALSLNRVGGTPGVIVKALESNAGITVFDSQQRMRARLALEGHEIDGIPRVELLGGRDRGLMRVGLQPDDGQGAPVPPDLTILDTQGTGALIRTMEAAVNAQTQEVMEMKDLEPLICAEREGAERIVTESKEEDGTDWLEERYEEYSNDPAKLDPVVLLPGFLASVLKRKQGGSFKDCYFGDSSDYDVFFMAPRYAMVNEKYHDFYRHLGLNLTEDGHGNLLYEENGDANVCPHDFGGEKGVDYLARSYLDREAHWKEFIARFFPQDALKRVTYDYTGDLFDDDSEQDPDSDWVSGERFATVIHYLKVAGYDVGVNLFAAPYDWRKPVHALKDYYQALYELLEEAKENSDGRRVVLVAHSMGCLHALAFMRWVETHKVDGVRWIDKTIKSMVTINGPWLGCPQATRALGGFKISGARLDNTPWPREDLLFVSRTFGSLPWIMPVRDYVNQTAKIHDLRNAMQWVPSRDPDPAPVVKVTNIALASHGFRDVEYSPDHCQDLFKDLMLQDVARLYEDVSSKCADSSTIQPRVPLYCFYGHGLSTEYSLKYDYDNATKYVPENPESEYHCADGDGLIPTSSLRFCESFDSLQYSIPFRRRGHSAILQDAFVVDEILRIVTGNPRDPIKEGAKDGHLYDSVDVRGRPRDGS